MSDSVVPTPSENPEWCCEIVNHTNSAFPMKRCVAHGQVFNADLSCPGPTPSEKPTCEHGGGEKHDWVNMGGSSSLREFCPGPVIATEPETPTVRWHKAMDHLCRQIREFRPGNMMSLNLIIKANVVEFEGLTPECVSTEPETPVPEDDELGEISSVLEAFRQRNPAPLERLVEQPAATSAHGATNLAADRGSNESAFVQVGGVLEHWGARPSKTPVSDPSPELRERFFVAFEKYNSHGSHINHDDYEEMVDEISEKIEALKRPMPLYQQGARYPNHWNDALDAVLAALGEKKSNG